LVFAVSRSAQSKSSNSFCSSGVTQALSLALLGLIAGVGSPDGDADGESEGEEDGASVSPGVGVGVGVSPTLETAAASESMTARNSSLAEDSMRSIVAWSGMPGSETTTLFAPCVLISDSETPAASMRWRMMATAWLS
jgi:hypothetical protein